MDDKKIDIMKRMLSHSIKMAEMNERLNTAVVALKNSAEFKKCEEIEQEIENFHNTDESKALHAEALAHAQEIIDGSDAIEPIKEAFERVTGLKRKEKKEEIGIA
jgi:hypothetical protein